MRPLEWTGHSLKIMDQTKLPGRRITLELDDYRKVIQAIKCLQVRGAPVIGIAAAYGIALAAREIEARQPDDFRAALDDVMRQFAASRPTAVDLFHAIDRMRGALARARDARGAAAALAAEAAAIEAEQVAATTRLSRHGAELLQDGFTVMTHCNAGPLATAGEGTALGVIMSAVRQGKRISVYANETRPLLQGARLTACELFEAGIDVTVITDSMAGYVMSLGKVNAVITGADRVTANGDAANKIGTYSVAVLAHEHGIPFYIAAPSSTFDLALSSGKDIPIEERDPSEITHLGRKCLAPRGVRAFNPAFDVTPARYITAIITEKGIIQPVDRENIGKWAALP